jgi:hypothetical protein
MVDYTPDQGRQRGFIRLEGFDSSELYSSLTMHRLVRFPLQTFSGDVMATRSQEQRDNISRMERSRDDRHPSYARVDFWRKE